MALSEMYEEALVSNVYTVFEAVDNNKLMPEYLMMWFRRPEFDRYSRYMSHGSVREIFGWEEMCGVMFSVPPIEKQRKIVREYSTIVNRIKLNERLNQKLEETAQVLFRNYFIDNDHSEYEEIDRYIEYNPKHTIKKGKIVSYVEMADLQESSLSIKNVI